MQSVLGSRVLKFAAALVLFEAVIFNAARCQSQHDGEVDAFAQWEASSRVPGTWFCVDYRADIDYCKSIDQVTWTGANTGLITDITRRQTQGIGPIIVTATYPFYTSNAQACFGGDSAKFQFTFQEEDVKAIQDQFIAVSNSSRPKGVKLVCTNFFARAGGMFSHFYVDGVEDGQEVSITTSIVKPPICSSSIKARDDENC